MKVEKLAPFPSRYPDQPADRLLFQGFSAVFLIPCALASVPPIPANLQSARLHPSLVSAKLALGRMAGPFTAPPLDGLVIFPLAVVPKEPNSFWLIHHLSHPKGDSVNDAIDCNFCALLGVL